MKSWFSRVRTRLSFANVVSALALFLALGGTSNYFRRQALQDAGGWDAWNVTEDADIGLRLARMGHHAQTISPPTYEEAPARLRPWRLSSRSALR